MVGKLTLRAISGLRGIGFGSGQSLGDAIKEGLYIMSGLGASFDKKASQLFGLFLALLRRHLPIQRI